MMGTATSVAAHAVRVGTRRSLHRSAAAAFSTVQQQRIGGTYTAATRGPPLSSWPSAISPLPSVLARLIPSAEALTAHKHEIVTSTNKFEQTLQKHYTGAVLERQFLNDMTASLATLGFTKDNTLACVGVCRDEICTPFLMGVRKHFGEAFSLRGLAGLNSAGRTGFMAAKGHAPDDAVDGRRRYVYFIAPHIAIDCKGVPGQLCRTHMEHNTGACGALLALRKEIEIGHLEHGTEIDVKDLEMTALKVALTPYIDVTQRKVDLVELTNATKSLMVDQVQECIDTCIDNSEKVDYAVIVGVQVHGPEGTDYWVADHKSSYAVVSGQRVIL